MLKAESGPSAFRNFVRLVRPLLDPFAGYQCPELPTVRVGQNRKSHRGHSGVKVGFIAAQNLQIPTAFWRLAHVCRELFVVLAQFGKHIQRRHEIRVVVENALQTCNVPDRTHRRTADFADTPGESALVDGNGLLGLYGLRPLPQRDS